MEFLLLLLHVWMSRCLRHNWGSRRMMPTPREARKKKKKEKTSDAQRIPNDPMGIVTHRSFLLLLLPPYFHGIKLRDGTFVYQHRMLLPQPMYVIRLPLGMLLTTGQHLTLSVLLKFAVCSRENT